ETFRNNVLDSRSFFDTSLPPLRQNHFGGAFGGAIKKDKLFYFGNVQFVRDVVGNTLRGSVPTASELQGDLSDIPGISLHNPFTGAPIGAVIPQSQFDPLASKYIALLGTKVFPAPNLPGPGGSINRTVQSNKLQTDNYFDVRVDYNKSEKDSFFGRFGYGNSAVINASFNPYTTSSPYNSRNGVIGWTHIFNPGLINEFHFGLDRVNNRPNQPYGPGVGSEDFNTQLGLFGANTYAPCKAPVSLSVTGFTGLDAIFLCDISLSNNYAYNDSVVYVRGKHSIQFGGDLTRYQVTNPIFNGQPGSFSYTGQYSGIAWADFLLGYVQNANAITKSSLPYRRLWNLGTYIEDKYQITRNLTINAGLRYELSQPPHDKYNNLSAFVPGA